MQELSPEMSEKERMISVSTAAPRTVLLSETTDKLKLEVPDATSQHPKSYREQRRRLRFNSSTEWCTSHPCNRGKYPDAGQTVQTTVELLQVQFLDKGVDIHAAGEARTNVKLLDADASRRSTLICPIRQEHKTERSEAQRTHMERHRVRTAELVASHDAVEGRSTTSQLDIHGSQWQRR